MNVITRAFRDEGTGNIFHITDRNQPIQYRDIRAGLSWPVKSFPAYYCIFGKLNLENPVKRYPLVFLCECESKDLQGLFHKLTDDGTRLLCNTIYADIANESECYRDAFSGFCSDTNTKGLYIQQAPYTENFRYGMDLIQQYSGNRTLEISTDSFLRTQLRSIEEDALGEKPEEKFYAINALRFVLGSFKKYGTGLNASSNMTQEKADEMRRMYGPPGVF